MHKAKNIAQTHGHMTAHNTGDVIILGGPKEVSGGFQNLLLVTTL